MNYNIWKNHFANNYDHLDHITFEDDSISFEEIDIIKSSIQQFQRGENSEGKHLIDFAKNSRFQNYHESIIHFIKEEQRHAMILGKWMKLHEIPRINGHWLDNIFRKLRRFSNLENSIRILLTAEIIAAVYYKALRDATSSPTLQSICKQILIDEDIHLEFQCYTISHFQSARSRVMKRLHNFKQKILMTGTIIVVWKEHRQVLKNGGYSLFGFSTEVFLVLNKCLSMMEDPCLLVKGPLKFQRA